MLRTADAKRQAALGRGRAAPLPRPLAACVGARRGGSSTTSSAARRDTRAAPPAALPRWAEQAHATARQALRRAAAAAAASLAAAALVLGPPPPASIADQVIRLPASDNPGILAAQQTLVQAWQIVGESFFDATYGGANWTAELREHMLAAYASPDPAGAYAEIGRMLSDLRDPYTRLLPPDEYADFVVASSGELHGVGMLIANEPVGGHLLVLAPIKGSPADRAGVRAGDLLLSVNGEDATGWTSEQAAQHLRGEGGTRVTVRLVRDSDQIPGVPGRPPPPPAGAPVAQREELEVALTRERVALSPLAYGTLPGLRGERLGYLRLLQFSSNAGEAVRDAVTELQGQGVGAFVLDLRSNPGGLVQSAAEVARVFLDGSPTLFTVSGRAGEQLQEVALEEGAPLTDAPLAVLVDHGSASASEILSGALHDNHRAVVIGDEKTYGKGRIQSVYEMDDGSALFVTVARYRTPSGAEIDMRGIRPDVACTPPLLGAARPARGGPAPPPAAALPGILFGEAPASADGDRCLMTAVNLLGDRSSVIEATRGAVLASARGGTR